MTCCKVFSCLNWISFFMNVTVLYSPKEYYENNYCFMGVLCPWVLLASAPGSSASFTAIICYGSLSKFKNGFWVPQTYSPSTKKWALVQYISFYLIHKQGVYDQAFLFLDKLSRLALKRNTAIRFSFCKVLNFIVRSIIYLLLEHRYLWMQSQAKKMYWPEENERFYKMLQSSINNMLLCVWALLMSRRKFPGKTRAST